MGGLHPGFIPASRGEWRLTPPITMSRVVHQDPKTQPVQKGQNEPVQDAIPHGDDVLDGSVETNNAKEEYGVQDEADFEVRFESGDSTNLKEWSSWSRARALFCIAFSSFVVSLYIHIRTFPASCTFPFLVYPLRDYYRLKRCKWNI
ncbi:hypothetical protein M752DRAFT_312269 [Aspergillus phoenicis ATCC 13157]|uniref:Uncharacterized protein n=1 Tax=Aspergillus phoenicis ATCC 13157 TaxID=1353007 RepID=A0A370PUS5_ASPPH|nr:hypothetical protein M752DRAFT_312269 [Aspergillus phoenicis ATCC 13157]